MKFKADGTITPDIYDHFTKAKNEAKELQACLTLARELIAALTNNGQLSPRLMTPETKTLWERWQAEEMTK